MFQQRKQITVSVPAGGPTTGGTKEDLSNLPQAHTEPLCAQAECWSRGPRVTPGGFQKFIVPRCLQLWGEETSQHAREKPWNLIMAAPESLLCGELRCPGD